jgi:hypothetical protein
MYACGSVNTADVSAVRQRIRLCIEQQEIAINALKGFSVSASNDW